MRAIPLLLLLPLVTLSCGKRESFENSDEEKKKICDGISKTALKEPGAIVQPPALTPAKPKVRAFDKVRFSKGAHIVGGVNILALEQAGLIQTFANNLPKWYEVNLGMTLLNLPPGRAAETLFFEAQLKSSGLEVAAGRLWLMGNFTVSAVFGVLNMLSATGRLPFSLKRMGKGVQATYAGHTINADAVTPKLMQVTLGKPAPGALKGTPIYDAMQRNIPWDTAVWFILMKPPIPKKLPKMFRKPLSQLEYISGYLNLSRDKRLEVQLRVRFATPDTALSTKELVRLAASRAMKKLGPIVNKSFNLNSAQNMNIVSRGPLVRILFNMDRHQTNYLLRQLGRLLRENSSVIPVLGGQRLPPPQPAPQTPNGDATPLAPPR